MPTQLREEPLLRGRQAARLQRRARGHEVVRWSLELDGVPRLELHHVEAQFLGAKLELVCPVESTERRRDLALGLDGAVSDPMLFPRLRWEDHLVPHSC